MENKSFWVVLGGGLLTVISIVGSAAELLPSFLAPFVAVIYGLLIFYMSR